MMREQHEKELKEQLLNESEQARLEQELKMQQLQISSSPADEDGGDTGLSAVAMYDYQASKCLVSFFKKMNSSSLDFIQVC